MLHVLVRDQLAGCVADQPVNVDDDAPVGIDVARVERRVRPLPELDAVIARRARAPEDARTGGGGR